MKKLLLALSLVIVGNVFAENIKPEKVGHRDTVCIDGIRYFVGVSFDGQLGFKNQFIASIKIDPKTMQPEKCS